MALLKDKMLHVWFNAVNHTNLAYKMGVETFNLTITSNDFLYVGYKKAFRNLFIELKTANTNNSNLIIEYWNGSAWTALDHIDETKGFKKSGFILLGEDVQKSVKNTVNSIEANWLRIKVSANTSAMVCNGLNCLLNSEDDLLSYEPAVKRFYPRDIQSHVLSLTAARDWVMRKINNSGHWYYKAVNPLTAQEDYIYAEDYVVFDTFHKDELADVGCFISLHFIFANRSDTPDDIYAEKSRFWLAKAEEAFKLWAGRKLTLDIDKDGVESFSEQAMSIRSGSFVR